MQVVCNNVEYGNDKLKSVSIHPALYDSSGVKVGNAYSSYCKITVMEESKNWPRMAQFTIRVRLSDSTGETKSSWVNMGTFYTDERYDDTNGNLSITGFDSMLMTEQYWTDKIEESALPSNWPITSRAWVSMIEGAGLIEVDPATVLDNTVALIGLNTASTIRDNLKTIAAAHGGNWVATPDGKLKLVFFHNIVDGQAAIAGIAITGVSVVGDDVIESAAGLDLNFLGMNVQRLDVSPELTEITGVNLESEDGTVASAGTTTGYVLNGNCEFASTNGVAELCLGKVQGYRYRPFRAERAILDPAAEVGDLVIIDGRSYQIMVIDWNLSTWPTAEISAPYDAEVDHEYQIISPEAKTYRKGLAATDEKLKLYPTTTEMNTAISQTASEIRIEASQTYVTVEDYDETIANLQEQIDGTISTFSGPDVPTLSNYPAVDWDTPAEKSNHVGALYLVTSDGGSPMAGQYYRFEQSGSSFGWTLVEDSALATALARAAEAQAAADQAQQDADAAQAAADAAQGTADQARLDAVARAAEAQAVAITQAAVDATQKANQALEDAKDYATQQIEHFVFGEYAQDMAEIREQVDQKVETYYQSDDPSAGWEDPTEHTGDLWYNTTTQLYYRWDGTSWEELTSNPPRAVFDTIDGKAQVFINEPVPPYYVGDLWAQGATGDILRCTTERTSGSFESSDWTLASKYTDDSSLNMFITGPYAEMMESIRSQIDQKAETFYQADDPSMVDGKTRWNTVAGIAIAGISIVGSSNEGHKGDMWYRTTDDTTWYWNGTQWVEQTISKDVFDFIDGKAQIFVSQPIPPYQVGDLWFNSATSDIMTCILSRESGSYTASDWQKRNKYTDDEKANAVETDLHGNYYTKVETTAEIETTATEIRAAVVSKTGNNSQQSFSWSLTDSAHVWYHNNAEVLRIDGSGLHVNGDGTFSGTVSAATIVGSTIEGGSINIGNGAFRVDSAGNLYASSGSFTGNVYASNIQYGSTGGYFSGLGITGGSLTTGQMGTGINTSLGYANFANDVMNNRDSAPFIMCEKIGIREVGTATRMAASTFSGVNYLIDVNDVSYNMGIHTHQISADSDGKVTIGAADWTGTSHFFNIADTAFYKRNVSAVTVRSISAARDTAEANIVWNATTKTLSADFTMSAKNEAGTVVYREQEYPITMPATKAFNAGKNEGANSVDVTGVTASISNTHSVESGHHYVVTDITGTARATKADGTYATNSETFTGRRITADQVYNDGQDAGANSVDVTGVTATVSNTHLVDSGHHYVVTTLTPTARATKSDGTYATNSEAFTDRRITADQVYSDGVAAGGYISTVAQTSYSTSANHSVGVTDANARYTSGMMYGRIMATLGNGTQESIYVGIDGTKAYNSGESSVYVNAPYSQGRGSYYWGSDDQLYSSIGVAASASNGSSNSNTLTFGVSDIYNYGRDSAPQRYVEEIYTYGSISYYYNGGSPYYTLNARARMSDGTYSDLFQITVNGTSAYSDGKTDGVWNCWNSVGVWFDYWYVEYVPSVGRSLYAGRAVADVYINGSYYRKDQSGTNYFYL